MCIRDTNCTPDEIEIVANIRHVCAYCMHARYSPVQAAWGHAEKSFNASTSSELDSTWSDRILSIFQLAVYEDKKFVKKIMYL